MGWLSPRLSTTSPTLNTSPTTGGESCLTPLPPYSSMRRPRSQISSPPIPADEQGRLPNPSSPEPVPNGGIERRGSRVPEFADLLAHDPHVSISSRVGLQILQPHSPSLSPVSETETLITRPLSTNEQIVQLSPTLAIRGTDVGLVLHELHRLRNSRRRSVRRNRAGWLGLWTIGVLGAAAWMVVEAVISVLVLGEGSGRDGHGGARKKVLWAEVGVGVFTALVAVGVLLLARLARRATRLSRPLLVLAILSALGTFAISLMNLALVFFWDDDADSRCSWGINIAWTSGSGGAMCAASFEGQGQPWRIAAGVRVIITLFVVMIWIVVLRRFNLTLSTTLIINPNLSSSEVQTILALHHAEIIALRPAEPDSQSPNNVPFVSSPLVNDDLPHMPERGNETRRYHVEASEGSGEWLPEWMPHLDTLRKNKKLQRELRRSGSSAARGSRGASNGESGTGGGLGATLWGAATWLFSGYSSTDQATRARDEEEAVRLTPDREQHDEMRERDRSPGRPMSSHPECESHQHRGNGPEHLADDQDRDITSPARSMLRGTYEYAEVDVGRGVPMAQRPASEFRGLFGNISGRPRANSVASSTGTATPLNPPRSEYVEALEARRESMLSHEDSSYSYTADELDDEGGLGFCSPPSESPPGTPGRSDDRRNETLPPIPPSAHGREGSIVFVRMGDGRLVRKLSTIASEGSGEFGMGRDASMRSLTASTGRSADGRPGPALDDVVETTNA